MLPVFPVEAGAQNALHWTSAVYEPRQGASCHEPLAGESRRSRIASRRARLLERPDLLAGCFDTSSLERVVGGDCPRPPGQPAVALIGPPRHFPGETALLPRRGDRTRDKPCSAGLVPRLTMQCRKSCEPSSITVPVARPG